MTFLNQANVSRSAPHYDLSQRGRSGVEFLGTLQKFSSGQLRQRARADFAADPEGAALLARAQDRVNQPQGLRIEQARRVAERSPNYLYERLYQRYVAEEVYLRGIPAIEERREEFEAFWKDDGPDVGGTLELNPSLAVPDYYQGVQWHLEPDGWDGYDLYGCMFAFVAGPYVFKHGGYAAVEAGDNIIQQRISVISQLPRRDYTRIYEPGCGGVSTIACAREIFPQAELIGSDLSPLLLRMGHITANRLGIKAAFKQRDCRATGEPDASVDAVIMYALLHEMPPEVGIATLKEALRILKPGGDIVISDPPPFRAVDAFQAAVLDWDTKHRGEPFFSDACAMDWAEEMKALGYVNVDAKALGERGYPWVTTGSKPS